MENRGHKKKNWIFFGMFLSMFLLLTGCGGAKESHVKVGNEVHSGLTDEKEKQVRKEKQEKKKEIEEKKEITYAILQFNEEEDSVRLQNTETGKVVEYGISDATAFRDKYGDFTDSADMEQGRMVKAGSENTNGELSYLQLADSGWEQENIERFAIDQELQMITIGQSKYQYDADLLVFLDGEQISLDAITENDSLRAAGIDKKVVSLSVTRGHGFLTLSHTDLFEGGWISVGNEYVLKIEKDLKIEVPEGTYQVSAANNGYGDTKEVTIASNETTVINLEEYKGAGPKKGKILFKLDPEDAAVMIDGNQVDALQPVELQYGVYQLEISAENYTTLSKKLVVGAAQAELEISLEKENGTTDTGTSSDSSSGSKEKSSTKTSSKSKTSSDQSSSSKSKETSATSSQRDRDSTITSKDTDTSQDTIKKENEKLLQKISSFISTLLD